MQMLKTTLRVLNENKARLIQLASRYIGAGLIALAGALGVFQDDQGVAQLDNAAQVISIFAVGVVLFVIDLFIHRLDRGGVVADNPVKAKKLTKEKRP